MKRYFQTMSICVVCCLIFVSPFFFLASEVNRDEFVKTGMGAIGLVIAGIIGTAIKILHKSDDD